MEHGIVVNCCNVMFAEGLSLVQEKETLKRALILWNRSASQGPHLVHVCVCVFSSYRIVQFQVGKTDFRCLTCVYACTLMHLLMDKFLLGE